MEGKRSGMEGERASVGQRDNESVCGSTAEAEGPHGTLGTSIRLGVGGSNADGRPMPPHGMPTPPPVATPPRQGRAGQGRAGPANLRGEACSSCQEPGRYLRHPTRTPMMRSNNDGNNSHLEQQQRPMESTEQEGACACACIFFLMRALIEYPVGAQCLLLAAAVVAGADQELAGLGQVQVQVHAQVQGARNATGKSHQSLVRQRNARKETLRSTCFVRSTTQVTLRRAQDGRSDGTSTPIQPTRAGNFDGKPPVASLRRPPSARYGIGALKRSLARPSPPSTRLLPCAGAALGVARFHLNLTSEHLASPSVDLPPFHGFHATLRPPHGLT
ncbi:hypothetical protein PCL_02774 [Purpureocillium lilacinum]|uniref:Uncharacterized protein n=1 Tax=Purpureocillium lilacinum TaxID=33203 RepID=A0A2U3E035_PURLI|nr:hypothetical protein PCL_02774 [Purpureocillium lilacinum]